MAKVNITIAEIYDLMCPDCRAKLKELTKSKLVDTSIEQALKGEGKKAE